MEIAKINANSVDPDQTPHSDLVLHCFYTFWKCPFYGTLDINELKHKQ